ncbi:hypothetical protein J2S73_003344 [Amorphus orientalis]|uniref:Uncharacterized protein n=1 Tax=Amorphus orientalis TaxID=649198 RepID=A0AAE3VRM5_9HYPH|nr:hypothetical protein [Amorphus orientalis]
MACLPALGRGASGPDRATRPAGGAGRSGTEDPGHGSRGTGRRTPAAAGCSIGSSVEEAGRVVQTNTERSGRSSRPDTGGRDRLIRDGHAFVRPFRRHPRKGRPRSVVRTGAPYSEFRVDLQRGASPSDPYPGTSTASACRLLRFGSSLKGSGTGLMIDFWLRVKKINQARVCPRPRSPQSVEGRQIIAARSRFCMGMVQFRRSDARLTADRRCYFYRQIK